MNLPVPDPILLTNSHDGLDGPTYKKRRFLDECEEAFQGTKVFVMPNGMLKSNQQLVDIIEKVKPESRLLIEKCNTVKMWENRKQSLRPPAAAGPGPENRASNCREAP
ncbi:Proteasome activator complex subunit 3 [Cricetulus griseus]|uniref:Proteasome activator complex subunit 3 n=1 Tax=Cricetulus griseus TaxID=10029 RepID=G3IIM4_CRIGR|nr:Proteasome activator complex subunit 3 [Cricetulus griseus]